MTGLIIVLHVVICALLITLILIQRGRGGGLVDSFSDMESMLGAKTNAFLTRFTAVLSTLFFITCLALALLSAQRSKSLMNRTKAIEATTPVSTTPSTLPTAPEAPKAE